MFEIIKKYKFELIILILVVVIGYVTNISKQRQVDQLEQEFAQLKVPDTKDVNLVVSNHQAKQVLTWGRNDLDAFLKGDNFTNNSDCFNHLRNMFIKTGIQPITLKSSISDKREYLSGFSYNIENFGVSTSSLTHKSYDLYLNISVKFNNRITNSNQKILHFKFNNSGELMSINSLKTDNDSGGD